MTLLDSSSDDEQEEVELGASNGVSQGLPDRSNSSNVIINNSSLIEADPVSLQNFLPIPSDILSDAGSSTNPKQRHTLKIQQQKAELWRSDAPTRRIVNSSK